LPQRQYLRSLFRLQRVDLVILQTKNLLYQCHLDELTLRQSRSTFSGPIVAGAAGDGATTGVDKRREAEGEAGEEQGRTAWRVCEIALGMDSLVGGGFPSGNGGSKFAGRACSTVTMKVQTYRENRVHTSEAICCGRVVPSFSEKSTRSCCDPTSYPFRFLKAVTAVAMCQCLLS